MSKIALMEGYKADSKALIAKLDRAIQVTGLAEATLATRHCGGMGFRTSLRNGKIGGQRMFKVGENLDTAIDVAKMLKHADKYITQETQ